MSYKSKAGILSAIVATLIVSAPAYADTLQRFVCDQRGTVSFDNPTSHDKRFMIPGVNKVAHYRHW